MQKGQRSCTKLGRLHLRRHIPDRNFMIYLGVIILTKKMGRRRNASRRKRPAASGSSQMMKGICEDLIGRTIRFHDRIQCYQCDVADPYVVCPNIDNPTDCPQKEYKIMVEKVSVSREVGKNVYTINDDYDFPAEDFWRMVRVGKTE